MKKYILFDHDGVLVDTEFWYYKAGFNAARLLEEDSKWESAVAIYDKLVAAGGGRSDRLNPTRGHGRGSRMTIVVSRDRSLAFAFV